MRPLTIVVAMLVAGDAYAEPDAYAERPFALSGHVGAGTPLGFYGFAIDVAVQPALSLEAGVGSGMSGTQLAVGARARVLRSGDYAFAIGAGISEGHYEHRDPFYGIEYLSTVVDRAWWANAELSIERRTMSGFQLRTYAGLGFLFAGERERCSDGNFGTMPCSGSARGLSNPYVGLSLGYAPEI